MTTEIFRFNQLLNALNNGTATPKQVNWQDVVLTSYRATQAKCPCPFIVYLCAMLSEMHIRTYRTDALNIIIENLYTYFVGICNHKETIDIFEKECKSLKNYFSKVNYFIASDSKAGVIYNRNIDKNQFEVESLIYFNCIEEPENIAEYLAYTQALCALSIQEPHIKLISQHAPILASLYYNIIIPQDIIYFCGSLFMAETIRQRYLNGWKPTRVVTIDTFPLDLRNNCFDEYIRIRTGFILDELMQDNNRLYRPSELECMNILLEDEQQAYNRLKGMEQFVGSHAYDAIWKPCTPDILRMAELFFAFLQDKIQQMQYPQPEANQSDTTYRPKYCTYILTDVAKTRDEIETDIERSSKKSAQTFARLLTSYREQHYLDFRGETPREIFEYMKERYNLPYSAANFTRYFKG